MASSLDEIKKLKKKLGKSTEPETALEILGTLSKCEISIQILKETKIGKGVGKLRKHENKQIAQASTDLVNKWKQQIGGGSETTTSRSSTPPTTPPNENNNSANGSESKVKTENKSEDTNKKRKTDKEESPVQTKKKVKKEGSGDNDGDSSGQETNKSKSASSKSKGSSGGAGSSADQGLRDKVVTMLKEALGMKLEGDLDPQDVATQIESELFDSLKGTSREYKAKVRSLTFNLKNPKNPALRQQVLGGYITAKQLCSMSAYDMASDELKKERQRMAEYHLEAAKLIQLNQTSTDMFKCSKCGKRETTYYQLQTRSADEPMTTFHTCMVCGNRWKS